MTFWNNLTYLKNNVDCFGIKQKKMNINSWSVVGIGSEALRDVKAFQRTAERISLFEHNVIVVEQPDKMTRLVDVLVEQRTATALRETLEYCKSFVYGLEIGRHDVRIDILFEKLEEALESLRGAFCKSEEEACAAKVLVLSREFFSMLFVEELRNICSCVEYLDAKEIIYAHTTGDSCADFAQDIIKQKVRSFMTDKNTFYVIAAGVGGLMALGTHPVLLGECDMTAAIMASCLSTEREPAKLFYIKKIFGIGVPESVTGMKRLLTFMKDSGKKVVSPYIMSVDNLPYMMVLLDADNPTLSTYVTIDPLVIEYWRGDID
ncbi:MAG: hypothetical protein QG580_430 [Patescibacteria group bacterium]|jgi:hypothetical protein|nr:hypothetical protein [Patescibacteria group bacterium]